MTMPLKKELDEAEREARITIARIVGLLYDVPAERVPAIKEHLDKALAEAKSAVHQARTGKLSESAAGAGAALSLLLLAPLVMAFAACPTEGDRQTLDQTKKAGTYIKESDSPPEVKKAGSDVELNAAVLQKTVIGEPLEETQPYSPKASEAARDRAVKEDSEPPAFLKWVANAVSPLIPWATPVLMGVWGVLERVGKARALERLKAIYQGVETVKAKVGNGQYADAITDTLRTVAGGMNVYMDIKRELGALRKSGEVSEVKPSAATPPG